MAGRAIGLVSVLAWCEWNEKKREMKRMDNDSSVTLSALCHNVERWLELQAESAAAVLAAVQHEHQQLLAALDVVEKQCATASSSMLPVHALPLNAPSSPDSLAPSTPKRAESNAVERIPPEECKTSYPSIATVLTARARSQHGGVSRPLPLPSLDVESPPRPRLSPPTPLAMLALGGGDSPVARQLRLVFVRHGLQAWRAARPGTAAIAALLLARGATAAPALAKTAALRRLAQRSRESHAVDVNLVWALRAALSGHWCRLCTGVARAASAHECLRKAVEHVRPAQLQGALRQWTAHTSAARACRLATAAVAEVAHRSQHAMAIRRWRGWVLRRAAWRRRVVRRTEATGGRVTLHLPAMKAFDARAVFIEEGATAMADAYRRRRTAAVVLCRWLCVVVRM